MRLLVRLAAVLMLAACQLQAPAPGGDAAPLAPESIAVTKLDAAPVEAATRAASKPPEKLAPAAAVDVNPAPVAPADAKPAPQSSAPAAPVAATEPAPTVSPEQALCEKSKGQWSALADSSGHVCVHTTRDSGKSCHRKGDCQGQCLAQSGTCSPIMPLMGCNAVLQADGSEVTLCLQ